MVRIVNKPWGHETIWAHTDKYVGKILFIKAGEQLSLQYHVHKMETIIISAGIIKLEYYEVEDSASHTVLLGVGDTFHIPPGMRHRMIGVEDAHVVEVSTPELDDIVRIEDKYGRIEDKNGS